MRTISCILIWALLACPGAAVQAEGLEDPVASGREALRSAGDFPWYDAERDAIQRVDVSPPEDVTARKSTLEAQNRAWTVPDWVATLARILGWTLLVLVILALVYLLFRAASSSDWMGDAEGQPGEESAHGDIDRIEALPFQLKASQGDLLARARQFYDAGDFSQAIVYLYSYQLIQLDRYQLIRLAKGKTNRQYLRELRGQSELQDLLKRSVYLFEEVFFGRHPVDRDQFAACWGRLDDFHQILGRTAA